MHATTLLVLFGTIYLLKYLYTVSTHTNTCMLYCDRIDWALLGRYCRFIFTYLTNGTVKYPIWISN